MLKGAPFLALCTVLGVALWWGADGQASADPIISVNPPDYIPTRPPYSGSTAFVIPIEITRAVELTSWQFSLAFDPADVQINTGCDSSGSDPYCDPIFGPVTEGPFFSSVALFPPFFDPGFIFNDVGLLDTVAGAWQDSPPGPSGDGILAYVEFITTETGTGESPITVIGASPTTSVPEPGTLALLAGGLVLLGRRRLADRRQHHRGASDEKSMEESFRAVGNWHVARRERAGAGR